MSARCCQTSQVKAAGLNDPTRLHLDGRRLLDVLGLKEAQDGLGHAHVRKVRDGRRQVVALGDNVELFPHLKRCIRVSVLGLSSVVVDAPHGHRTTERA